ncbi:helix-turn-helix transcriptional regulator [Enterococcus sp. DIV1420a]|uniref:helix-turn-helix transcriptional regulator n=1 Tax=Enterococcus sp. DIV1420a TaxID=2774672 RepID=UPI0036D4D0F9
MSPYKKIRIKAGMSQQELADKMQISLKLAKAYEKQGVDPSLHYVRNFKAIFNVTDDDINQLKTNGGL